MRLFLVLCLVALVATASAADDYSFDIIDSTDNSVRFEMECGRSSHCRDGGEEYCGDNEVQSMLCIEKDEICEVQCYPLDSKSSETKWTYASLGLSPNDKREDQEVVVTLNDYRDGSALIWDVEVYYGGGWVTEAVTGAANIGDSFAVSNTFTLSEYIKGDLVASGNTDRRGEFSFIPEEPGLYMIFTVGKYVRVPVGDNEGNVLECGNGICEEDLGEQAGLCPDDCKEEAPAPPEPVAMPSETTVCGNGICDGTETVETCLEDCGETAPEPAVPGSQDNQILRPVGQSSNDMSQVLVLIIIVGAIFATFAFLMMSGKLKKPSRGSKTVQITQQPRMCPKCGAQPPGESAYCVKCGAKI